MSVYNKKKLFNMFDKKKYKNYRKLSLKYINNSKYFPIYIIKILIITNLIF